MIFEYQLYLPWFALLAGLLCLTVTLAWAMAQPGRALRLAVLSGVLVHLELVVARAIVYNPEQWSAMDNPVLLRVGNHLLGTWLLMLVAMGWTYLRRGASRPLLLGLVLGLPGVGMALGLRLLDAWLRDGLPAVRMGLPYDIAVAFVAFVGPVITYEFLVHSDLWSNRPDGGTT